MDFGADIQTQPSMELDYCNAQNKENIFSDAEDQTKTVTAPLDDGLNDSGRSHHEDKLHESIVKQCEFYFSDANILKDQYMLNQVRLSKEGWVSLKKIAAFKRMEQLTTDLPTIVSALSMSQRLELSDDGRLTMFMFNVPTGRNVRRRDPMPTWDKRVFSRTIIISDLPDGTTITIKGINNLLAVENLVPLLIRIFPPKHKIPNDLRYSQVLHPQLGSELSVVVEFETRQLANKAISIVRKQWADAYVHLLSYKKSQLNDNVAPNNFKRQKFKSGGSPNGGADQSSGLPHQQPPASGPPVYLWNKKLAADASLPKVVHTREPLGPPSAESVGFEAGWRDSLSLQRVSLCSD